MTRYAILLLIALALAFQGCSTVAKFDAQMAAYVGVPTLSNDCKAGIAKLDSDINPTSTKRGEAVQRFADSNSSDYKQCYSSIAWLYYSGEKLEGAIRAWVKKIAVMGAAVP